MIWHILLHAHGTVLACQARHYIASREMTSWPGLRGHRPTGGSIGSIKLGHQKAADRYRLIDRSSSLPDRPDENYPRKNIHKISPCENNFEMYNTRLITSNYTQINETMYVHEKCHHDITIFHSVYHMVLITLRRTTGYRLDDRHLLTVFQVCAQPMRDVVTK